MFSQEMKRVIQQINDEFERLKTQVSRLEKKVDKLENPPKPKIGRPRKDAA